MELTENQLKLIALTDIHTRLGAKMVPFAGYLMPVSYEGINAEHETVRKGVGVFDVSHMGEFILKGADALDLIQRVTSNDASKLIDKKVQYSCLPNEQGGIVDDLLVYRIDDKALAIIAALELGRRRQLSEAEKKLQIKSSRDIYELIYPLISDLHYEEFWVLYLNKANKIIEKEKVSTGGLSGTVVDVKIILRNALQKLSSGIIFVHNHPSGNLQPSDADISITKKLKDAAKLLEITVLDHLIIGDKNYYSFADNG